MSQEVKIGQTWCGKWSNKEVEIYDKYFDHHLECEMICYYQDNIAHHMNIHDFLQRFNLLEDVEEKKENNMEFIEVDEVRVGQVWGIRNRGSGYVGAECRLNSIDGNGFAVFDGSQYFPDVDCNILIESEDYVCVKDAPKDAPKENNMEFIKVDEVKVGQVWGFLNDSSSEVEGACRIEQIKVVSNAKRFAVFESGVEILVGKLLNDRQYVCVEDAPKEEPVEEVCEVRAGQYWTHKFSKETQVVVKDVGMLSGVEMVFYLYPNTVADIFPIPLTEFLEQYDVLVENPADLYKDAQTMHMLKKLREKDHSEDDMEYMIRKLRGEDPKKDEKEDDNHDFSDILNSIGQMLAEKDKRYGNSALKPLDIFAKHHSYGARLDEKLARVKNSGELRKNDVADIIGGLVLICRDNGWTDFSDQID